MISEIQRCEVQSQPLTPLLPAPPPERSRSRDPFGFRHQTYRAARALPRRGLLGAGPPFAGGAPQDENSAV